MNEIFTYQQTSNSRHKFRFCGVASFVNKDILEVVGGKFRTCQSGKFQIVRHKILNMPNVFAQDAIISQVFIWCYPGQGKWLVYVHTHFPHLLRLDGPSSLSKLYCKLMFYFSFPCAVGVLFPIIPQSSMPFSEDYLLLFNTYLNLRNAFAFAAISVEAFPTKHCHRFIGVYFIHHLHSTQGS